ncbi:hypothetical protein Tco_0610740, partial [Tanacetum coccineum]
MKLEEMKQYLFNIIGMKIHALYYKVPHNGFLITIKLRNKYDMHVMFDISAVQGKLEIYIDHVDVNFIIAKYICPNASMSEIMNHVITDYTSDSEDERREVTQIDYTFDQMVEWAELEHFKNEETKEVQRQKPVRMNRTHFEAYTKKSEELCSVNLYAVSIKEDTTYLCLHITRNHKELKSNTPYPEDSIRCIEDYLKILEDTERGPYSKKPPICRIDPNQYGISKNFHFISDLEDQFEKEETDTMGEPTMEEYITKTRDGYGTGITRPKIDEKAYTEPSDGLAAIQAQLNNIGREIKKVNEKVYVAQVGCELCKGPPWCELCKGHHYTKDCPLKKDGNTLEEAYYTQFGVPFPQGGQYRAATPGFYQRNNGNPSYQERRKIREESLSKFMAESAKIHEENSYLIKEIRASMDAAIRNQGSSIKALEIQIGQMSK